MLGFNIYTPNTIHVFPEHAIVLRTTIAELLELSDLRNFMPSDFEKGNKVDFRAQNIVQHVSIITKNFFHEILSHKSRVTHLITSKSRITHLHSRFTALIEHLSRFTQSFKHQSRITHYPFATNRKLSVKSLYLSCLFLECSVKHACIFLIKKYHLMCGLNMNEPGWYIE